MTFQLSQTEGTILAALLLFMLSACDGSGKAVVEIALHPTKSNIVYIATNDYIFKTRDEGKTWENVSKGMTHSRVISLAVDPIQLDSPITLTVDEDFITPYSIHVTF